MKKHLLTYSVLLLSILSLSLSSCVKKDFDAPPNQNGVDPNLKVTTTIAQLNAFAINKVITDDIIVYGIVTADDRSGNLYKQIVIEDSTGGIALLLDQNSLYNDYPVGRKVYVKCKGLYVGNYNDIPQLGYTPDNTNAITNIPSTLIPTYVIKATYPNTITPKKVTLAQVKYTDFTLINRVITIDDVEFDSVSIYKKYADAAPITGTSRNIVDCDGNTIVLRTSGYANFQPVLTPAGRGSITAIYTSYKGTPQLILRDTSDVKFTGNRCGDVPPPPPPTAVPTVALDSIRNLYKGSDILLGNTAIKGVVISDQNGNNSNSLRLVTLQDGNKGITLFFNTTPKFFVGDSIVINVNGATLTSYNGALEISGVDVGSATLQGKGIVISTTLTIADLTAHMADYESRLVTIANGTITGGGTYLGNKSLTDGSGANLTLTTSKYAIFANDTIPATPKNFTGIVSPYNGAPELAIRNRADIQ